MITRGFKKFYFLRRTSAFSSQSAASFKPWYSAQYPSIILHGPRVRYDSSWLIHNPGCDPERAILAFGPLLFGKHHSLKDSQAKKLLSLLIEKYIVFFQKVLTFCLYPSPLSLLTSTETAMGIQYWEVSRFSKNRRGRVRPQFSKPCCYNNGTLVSGHPFRSLL
jgi:hypothetical protein